MCANIYIPNKQSQTRLKRLSSSSSSNKQMVQEKMKLNKQGVFHVKVHCSGRQNINPIRYLRDFYYTSI